MSNLHIDSTTEYHDGREKPFVVRVHDFFKIISGKRGHPGYPSTELMGYGTSMEDALADLTAKADTLKVKFADEINEKYL